jgi:hypothetical protein
MVLAACMLLASQAFADDWSTILPPQEGHPDPAKVARTERTIRPGELLTLPLPGSRSYICPVELDGDAVKVVNHEPHSSVTLQGVKPGKSTLRILQRFWRDPDEPRSYRLVEVVSVTVTSGFRERDQLLPERRAEKEPVPVPVRKDGMEWEGQLSLQQEELVTVVTDKREWTALWQRAFAVPAPEVDFERYGVACVFLGYKADWLYHIGFGEPRIENGLQVIPYGLAEIILELSGPFRAGGQFHMKAFERKQGYGFGLERASRSRT